MLRGGMQNWPLRISTILDHAARIHGAREIVTRTVEGPIHRTTYREIAGRARQCAAALQRLGIGAADRVGTLAWNTHRHLELWYGAGGANAIYHNVNPRLFDDQVAFIINDADDRLMFTDLTFVPLLEKLRDRCLMSRKVIVLTDRAHMPNSPLDLACYEELIAPESPDHPWAAGAETDPVGLCYTSGTTGAPKGVLYTHRSNVLHTLMMHGPDGLDFRSTSSVLPIVPMYHANAWTIAFSAPMVGAKLVLPGAKLDAESLCELMHAEDVTFSAGVPTVWIGMIEHLRKGAAPPPYLKRVITGGSACPRWIIEAFDQLGIEIIHAWGMTELSPIGTFSVPRPGMEALDPEARMGVRLKQGAPPYGVEIRIVDEAGRALPWDGETSGRLQVKGPAVVSEYLHGAGGDILDADGFFDTGDQANVDQRGFIQITDRTKDIIKSGGEWISSIELENHAACHPEVVEAAAIGIAHPKWGERPLLVVVRTPGSTLTDAALTDFLRPKIARWWLPETIVFADHIPHTATGKVNKLALRARYKDLQPPR